MRQPEPATLPRLLSGVTVGRRLTLVQHERVHGRRPLSVACLIDEIERSGLRGRGGADFPTARKLHAVASRRRRPSAVIVNGSETEPASGKDALLLSATPHLVLDGAVLAAAVTGAEQVIVKLADHRADVTDAVAAAIAERSGDPVPVTIAAGPSGYVTGEERAVVRWLGGGPAKPTAAPPRPFEKGLAGRPTLIQNVETLAQLALVARHGAGWFRELGTDADPGSVLVTISGDVSRPGVFEIPFGTALADVLDAAGGPADQTGAVLLGGYFGSWLDAADAVGLRLSRESLRAEGLTLGAGVVVVLGERADGLAEAARITRFLADESAGQCGPCVHGLAAIADGMTALAARPHDAAVRADLVRWCGQVSGRGACQHPTGAARFVRSAIDVFAADVRTARPRDRSREVVAA